MSASVSFKDIEVMLNDCAKGSDWRMTTHSRRIRFNGRIYPSLPKHDSIELGHVRKMVRYLQINLECAKKHLPI
jgi:hypothetical protein